MRLLSLSLAFLFVATLCRADESLQPTSDDLQKTLNQSQIEALFSLPPQNENGFSILEPSKQSKIMYVSDTDGNDATAVFYTISTPGLKNVYLPSNTIKPFKTIQAALNMARNNMPDYILLKRGDTFVITSSFQPKSGFSLKERSVISTYGSSVKRPVVESINDTSPHNTAVLFWGLPKNIAIMGIKFYAKDRDPNVSVVTSITKNRSGISYVAPRGGENAYHSMGLIIEDCWFDYFSNNGLVAFTYKGIKDVIFRRNIFTNNYSTTTANGHSQGLYVDRVSILLEDNLFDHNGWLNQASSNAVAQLGPATMFNHNTYFTGAFNTVLKNNAFFRASSMANKFTSNSKGPKNEINAWNILTLNNLYIDNEVGISAGGNDTFKNGARWRDIDIVGNVFLNMCQSKPTNRDIGWGIEINDWYYGNVHGNVFANWGGSNSLNNYAINISGFNSNISIKNNTIYNVYSFSPLVRLAELDSQNYPSYNENTSFENNILYVEYKKGGPLLDYSLALNGGVSGNHYFSNQDESKWFKFFGKFRSMAEYHVLASDKTSRASAIKFIAPNRSLEIFVKEKGLGKNIDDYVNVLEKQNRVNWDASIRPINLVNYIKHGLSEAKK